MFPLMSSLITGGAGLLGSIFSSGSAQEMNTQNIAMQRETNAMSAAEAQRNRDFQEQMSNTAYQRSSADMQKAGLNPMMMFGSGSAASTPGGAQAGFQAPRATENPGRAFENLGHVAKSAIDAGVSAKTMDLMTGQIANLLAENANIKARTATEEERAPLTRQQTLTEVERSNVEAARKELLRAGIPEATVNKWENEGIIGHIGEKGVGYVGAGKYGAGVVNKAMDTAMPFISGAKSALKYLHSWEPRGTGLTPSQTRNLYDRFESMRGN